MRLGHLFYYFVYKAFAWFTALFAIVTLAFFILQAIPGDPFGDEQLLRRDVHQELRAYYGLDQPLLIQYKNYLFQLAHGHLGYSFKYPGRSINQIIGEGLSISARLGIQAFIVALVGGFILGTWAALKVGRWPDRLVLLFTTFGISMPNFILATLLQYVFAIWLQWLPLARWGTFAQTILPTLALSFLPLAFITRLIRSELLEVLQKDYIKLVRAKGLPFSYWIRRHALRNALLPLFGYLAPLLTNILVGSFVIEKIFSIPGLGQWFVNSVTNRDYPLILGITVFYGSLLLTLTFIADLGYGWYDPRIRHAKVVSSTPALGNSLLIVERYARKRFIWPSIFGPIG